MGKRHLVGKAAAASVALGTLACALVAPRRGVEAIDAQWEEFSRFRYAHRGLHDNRGPAPENSLAAFRLAREGGYGSELDVHLTADGHLVVIHDSNPWRVCGVEGIVERMTLEELSHLRLFASSERIPTFEQVLECYEQGEGPCPPLVVEVKTHQSNYAELTAATMALLDAHAVPYCVESFDPRVVWWLRNNRPEVMRGQLAENFFRDEASTLDVAKKAAFGALAFNVLTRPDFVAYKHADRRHPSVRLACGVLGGKLVTWTVRSASELAEVEAAGGVGIFEGFEPGPLKG